MAIVASRLMVEVGADTRDAEAGVQGFDRKLNSITKDMTRAGIGLSAAVTAPLLGIATAALDSAGGFEQSMNILQQVVGATEGQMASLSEQALHLGAVTSFSAGEAAEGMLELGKAGMDTEQIMAAIPGVMDLAASAGTSLGQAAGITAAALNAFGLEASESTRVANLLAAGANASAADITDLAAGLQQAGFAFDLANQPIENLVASLAILTNVGLTGSDAGTALKNAFMRMMNPTAEAVALMNELNISFYDAQGNMQQLPAIIDMLNVAMADLTPQQRDAALATIFLSDGMKAMIPLMDAGAQGFTQMVTTVSAAGAATETANARMQGLRGGIEYLKGSIDSFLIGAAMPFLETLGGLARGAGDALTSFGALPQPIQNAALAFAGVMAAAGPLLLAIPALASAFGFLTGPIGLVVTALAALAAAWAADVGGIQAITATVAGQVQQAFGTMLSGARQLAGGIATAFANTSFPSLESLWEQFKGGDFQAIASTIRTTAFELMVNLNAELDITGQADQLRAQLVSLISSLGTALSTVNFDLTGMVNSLTAAINNQDWSALGSSLVRGIRAGTESVLSTDVTWAENFANDFAASVHTGFANIDWGALDSALVGLATAIREAIYGLASGIGAEMRAGFDTSDISGAFARLGTAIQTAFSDMIGGLVESIMGAVFTPNTDATSMSDLLRGRQAESQFEWPTPQWMTDFMNWQPTTPQWMTDFMNWQPTTPQWMTDLMSWQPAMPQWLSSLLDWQPSMPDWVAALLAALGGGGSGGRGGGGGFLVNPERLPIDEPPLLGGRKGRYSPRRPEAEMATSMAALEWDTYIQPLLWPDFVLPVEWTTFVLPLQWTAFVQPLGWADYVTPLQWAAFVSSLVWDLFVSRLNWGNFVPSLDWSRFISWLNIPGFAGGTNYAPGGLALVGERGPELVNLPRGSRVYDHRETAAMATGGITVNVNVASVASEIDIHSMARRIMREIQRNVR